MTRRAIIFPGYPGDIDFDAMTDEEFERAKARIERYNAAQPCCFRKGRRVITPEMAALMPAPFPPETNLIRQPQPFPRRFGDGCNAIR